MVGPIDVNQKGNASVRYWVNYVTLTSNLNHDLDPEFFKVKFWSRCISGIGMHTGTRYDPGTCTTLYWYKVSKWRMQNDIPIDTNISK